jgi:hypothetical protein
MYVNDLYKYFQIVGQIGRCVGSAGNEVVESFHFILTYFILGGEKKTIKIDLKGRDVPEILKLKNLFPCQCQS